jgi:hypothetical protein
MGLHVTVDSLGKMCYTLGTLVFEGVGVARLKYVGRHKGCTSREMIRTMVLEKTA